MKTIYTVGRDSDCDICFPDDRNIISRRHATIRVAGNGKCYISDYSMNGTYINGIRMRSGVEIPVNRDDIITFANVATLDWSLVPRSYHRVLVVAASVLAVLFSLGLIVAISVIYIGRCDKETEAAVTTSSDAISLPVHPADTVEIKIPAVDLPSGIEKSPAKDGKSPKITKNPKKDSDIIVNPIL